MFAELIPDVLYIILSLLDVSDFYSLRLTCRRLEQTSRAAYGAAAFTKLRVDFSKADMERMTDIANHEDFRLAVRELQMGYWKDRAKERRNSYEIALRDDGSWPHKQGGCLDLDSELVKEFVHILSRFPNCTRVTLAEDRAIAYFPENGGYERRLTSADMVELLLYAYSVPGAPPIYSFRIRIVHDRDWVLGLAGISGPAAVSVQRNWTAHLRELVLEFPANGDDNFMTMLHLLTSAPKLKTLRLVLRSNADGRPLGDLLCRHLDKFPDFTPSLEALTLGLLDLEEPILLRLLSACQDTLRTLDLYRVRVRSWKTILEYLYAIPFPKLRRLSMHSCADGSEGKIVGFCPLWKDQELQGLPGGTFEFKRSNTRGYQVHITGALFEAKPGTPTMKQALRALMERCHRCPSEYNGEAPCAPLHELRKVPLIAPYIVPHNNDYQRWTGLPGID